MNQRAETLFYRLRKGFEVISSGEAKEEHFTLYDRLMNEYIRSKKEYAKTPEDLHRCPNCPYLGMGVLYELEGIPILCDKDCK